VTRTLPFPHRPFIRVPGRSLNPPLPRLAQGVHLIVLIGDGIWPGRATPVQTQDNCRDQALAHACAVAVESHCRWQLKRILRRRMTEAQSRVPVSASNARPNFSLRTEAQVDNQVAAPAETRTPNLHGANHRSLKSADGRVATVVATRRK